MRVRGWRPAVGAVLIVLGVGVAWTAWQAWHVAQDLKNAQASAEQWRAALENGDTAARDRALTDLRDSAGSARDRTDGPLWSALTHLPFVGDDATGVQALSRSLDLVANDAVPPLSSAADGLGGLVADGRVDLKTVGSLEGPVHQAHEALTRADDAVSGLDSSGYVDALRTRFDRYTELVQGLRSGLASADKAVTVLPEMAGGDGPRNYLLLFQNNAEIRATGGMPGSWALLHADDGKVEMARQGTAGDFPPTAEPVIQLTNAEQQVYGKELGIYFQDPGWTADFPRAAALWHAHWNLRFPQTPIDGVIAVDPVALSYLLDGTGSVEVDGVTLTRQNAVEELLNKPYLEEGAAAQDAFFAKAAKAIFSSATDSLPSPTAFVEGLNRAASEGRLLVASFDSRVSDELAGTRVEGSLFSAGASIPAVDVGLNDLTGSKMSYYLRYHADVESTGCSRDGVQALAGAVTLSQAISPAQAANLPASITGGGDFGTEPGSQFVMVRIYGPDEGSIDQVRLNGRSLTNLQVVQIEGRPVVSVDVLLSTRRDVVLTWQGRSGPGQDEAGVLNTTPSIVPGTDRWSFRSAC